MPADWATEGVRQLAIVCRKHGLRCRVVRCKHQDSRLHIYREGDGFDERVRAANTEAREQNIDAAWTVVRAAN